MPKRIRRQDNRRRAAPPPTPPASERGGGVDETVKKLFLETLRKTGVALTATQLLDRARQKRLPLPTLAAVGQFLREAAPELVPFAGGRQRPPSGHYQTVGVSKPGVFFVDYGEFHREWAGSNSGATGFLVAVENLTNRLFAHATKGKDTKQWTNSLTLFLENTRDIKVIYSDRDSVARSERFRGELAEKYGLNWYFLKKGHKSFLAERYIGFLKRKLGQALVSRETPTKRWVDFLHPICAAYNSEKVPRTAYVRGAINKKTFDDFVGQLFGCKDPTLERYNSFKAGPFEHEAWNKACFRYEPGDRVHLLRSSAWLKNVGGKETAGAFTKASAEGSFTRQAFVVAGRQLRANRTYRRLVPVYSLKEFGERHLHFYESELRRASSAPPWRQERESHNGGSSSRL